MNRENDRSGWAMGYAAFAGVILIMLGFYRAAAGLVALFNDEFYVETEKYLFQFDVTAWGWINLIIGIGVLVAGFGIFTGNVLARTVGVVAAAISGLAAFAWMPYYPFWGIVFVALSVAVIWALTTHGRDIAEEIK